MRKPRRYVIFRPDGGWEQFTAHPERPDDHPRRHYPKGSEFVEVDRHTNDPAGEHYDRERREWVKVERSPEQQRAQRHAEFADWTPGQLIDHFEERLAELERRLSR